eukprot:m.169123 g.169123  ORF g.169123 m.169123 type:complete len:767 (-) comp31552_c0_seq6:254-2554(-)
MTDAVTTFLENLGSTGVPQAWKAAERVVAGFIQQQGENVVSLSADEAVEAATTLATLETYGYRDLFEAAMLDRLRTQLRQHILPMLISVSYDDGSLRTAVATTTTAIEPLLLMATKIFDPPIQSATTFRARIVQVVQTELSQPAYNTFYDECMRAYAAAFDAFASVNEILDEEASKTLLQNFAFAALKGELGGEVEDEIETLINVQTMGKLLQNVNIDSIMNQNARFRDLILKKVDTHVTETCQDVFDEEFLNPLEQWLDAVFLPCVKLILINATANEIAGWRSRLWQQIKETLCKLRIKEMFDIIVEHPDSSPAIIDLKQCLQATDSRGLLIQSLTASFKKRLQHPGANTGDILSQYVLSIKALRELDGSGVILDIVCGPVREYLRGREDTVRSVVTSLIDESNTEFSNELADGKLIVVGSSDTENESDDETEWMPDPIDADPSTSRSQRTGDVTSLLINIYGSKELFVNEYRNLLADRLLALSDYNIDKEARYLELLKLRFGEESMSQCDVMLKDIADSKRITSRVNEEKEETSLDLKVLILSRLFWPSLKGEDTLLVPDKIQTVLDEYVKKYEVLKAARTLDFKPQFGSMDLTLQFKDGTEREFTDVPTIVSTIIMHFEEQPQWSLEDLSAVMKVASPVVQKRIAFWQRAGLIRLVGPGQYVLDEEGVNTEGGQPQEDADDIAGSDDDSDDDDEMEMHLQFVKGMLANHPSLDVERIHSFLEMFVEDGFTKTVPQLKAFLDERVASGELAKTNGEYQLKPESE